MALGKYKVPRPIKDEDIWAKYFTKKRLLYLLVAILIAFFVFKIFNKIGLMFFGVLFGMWFIITALLLGFYTVPYGKYYLLGAGAGIDEILIRVFIRKNKKYIYTKNIAKEQSILDYGMNVSQEKVEDEEPDGIY